MSTLVYSPGIEVHIATSLNGILDVSDDLSQGSLTVAENSLASFQFTLNNHRRKYDGLFTPNDRIVVRMKRIKWVQVFSGYLDEVPYFSIYPRTVQMKASCTLKRLMYHFWDAGTEASVNLLRTDSGGTGQGQVDGGMRSKVVALLTNVAGWPQSNIHIGQIPSNWLDQVTKWAADAAAANPAPDLLGPGPVFSGTATTSGGTLVTPSDAPNTLCALPSGHGGCSEFGGPGDPSMTARGTFALTGELGRAPADTWYCAMRWGYALETGRAIVLLGSNAEQNAARNWLRNRRLIVSNPLNGKACIVRAADWGPGGTSNSDARVIDLAPAVMSAIGVVTYIPGSPAKNSYVDIRWADDPNAALGPVTIFDPATQSAQAKKDERQVLKAEGAAGGQAGSVAPVPAGSAPVLGALPFTPAPDNGGQIQAQVHAAREFIKQNWPFVYRFYGFNTTGHTAGSDHYSGHALDSDISTNDHMPTQAEQAKGNSLALWMVQNPKVFGVSKIIYRNHIFLMDAPQRGWAVFNPRGDGGISGDHWDHVHLSFYAANDGMTAPGPMGGGYCTGQEPFFTSVGVDSPGGVGYQPSGGVPVDNSGVATNLLNTFNWNPSADPTSAALSGPRALMNDTPILETIKMLLGAGMRNYMAAPNGDFIAWYPDYFDNFNIAGKLHIADIELMGDGFTMQWADDQLVTHQFTAGSPTGMSNGSQPGEAINLQAMIETQGIVTVEIPEIMQSLFNIDKSDPRSARFLDANGILNRFGVRPNFTPMGTITGPAAEFWYALKLFQENWAAQFSCQISVTFMPEAWPGMLAVVDSLGFQAYITQVTHSFDFSDAGGFTTQISVVAPSSLNGGLYGLPRSGSMQKVAPQPPKHP